MRMPSIQIGSGKDIMAICNSSVVLSFRLMRMVSFFFFLFERDVCG